MKIIQFAVLLSCAIHLCIGGRAVDIPPDLLAQLKSAQFHRDIDNIRGVRIVPMATNEIIAPRNDGVRSSSTRSRTMTSSIFNSDVSVNEDRNDGALDESSSGGGSSNSNTGGIVIRDPKQASNSCLKRDICVPVPVDDQDASVFVFPQCIELPQCLGSCCDSLQRCHPELVVPVKVEVKKWQYFDNGELHQVGTELVPMAKHLNCSCERCKESNVVCGPNHVRKGCACHCANEQAGSCNSPWEWSNDDCTCKCPINNCAAGEKLNARECKCFPSYDDRHHARNDVTDTTPAPRSLRSNVDGLPKLRSNIRTGKPTRRAGRFD